MTALRGGLEGAVGSELLDGRDALLRQDDLFAIDRAVVAVCPDGEGQERGFIVVGEEEGGRFIRDSVLQQGGNGLVVGQNLVNSFQLFKKDNQRYK